MASSMLKSGIFYKSSYTQSGNTAKRLRRIRFLTCLIKKVSSNKSGFA
jgi:hypothetical protein